MSKEIFKQLRNVMFTLVLALTFGLMVPGAVQKAYAEETSCTDECTWDEGKVTKEATCDEDGIMTFTCTICGNEKAEGTVIPKISSQELSYTKTVYSGSAKKPSVIVKDAEGNELVKDTDYTVSYATGRKKVGRYKVTITYEGKYSGSKSLYFAIVPKAPTSASASLSDVYQVNGHDDVKFTWKASTGATGYLVYYKKSSASKWSGPAAVTKTSYTKKDLSDGVKYTFKVIPYYKTSSGTTKYYSDKQYKTATVSTLKKGAGIVTKKGQKYFEYAKGKNAKSKFITVDKKTYYFDTKGVMVTGWMKLSGNYYFFNRSTGVQQKNCTIDGIKIKKTGKATLNTKNKNKMDLMITARKKMLEVTKPTDTKAQKLKKVFNWVKDHPYQRYLILPKAKSQYPSTWPVTYANHIFEKKKGCCVSESCAFAYMAKECGYTTVYVCDDTEHAWVEINGRVYDTLFAVSKSFNKYYNSTYKTAKLHCHAKTKI